MKVAAKITGPGSEDLLKYPDLIDQFWYIIKYYNIKSQFNHKRRPLIPQEIESIRDKSFFLIGEDDVFLNFPESERAMEKLKLNYKIIPNAGHGINQTRPQVVDAEIRDFLLG